jgi:hypothetical protein
MAVSSSRNPPIDLISRVRAYRQLCNALVPLLVAAIAILVFRWMFPFTFSLLLYWWAADAALLVMSAVAWLLLSWAFASGRIKCPACRGPFASGFHLWVPKTCHQCSFDVTAAAGR